MREGCNRKCFSFRFNENSNAHNYYETSRFLTASEVYTYACYSWQRDPGNKYVTRFQIIFMSSLLFSADNYWLSVCVVRGANYELLWQVSVWNNTTWYQCRGSPSTQRSIWPIDILAETRAAKLLTSETPACTHVREGWLLMETCAHTHTNPVKFILTCSLLMFVRTCKQSCGKNTQQVSSTDLETNSAIRKRHIIYIACIIYSCTYILYLYFKNNHLLLILQSQTASWKFEYQLLNTWAVWIQLTIFIYTTCHTQRVADHMQIPLLP